MSSQLYIAQSFITHVRTLLLTFPEALWKNVIVALLDLLVFGALRNQPPKKPPFDSVNQHYRNDYPLSERQRTYT